MVWRSDRSSMRLAPGSLANADLALKFHEVVALTLGNSLNDVMAMTFDVKLSDSSLRFFDLRDVPGIRGELPAGVSDVHFRWDLSALSAFSVRSLIDKSPAIGDLTSTRSRRLEATHRPSA